ncbi:hypothetical protein OKA05_16855 [Luteolibacter arcticus]|uniref:Uncharacterized protein n=1 Tax=Luteolibacter arcticus TaxID=1581411 RepID=A0ABT3GL45_9BACT|nr:hypothetical protein [Luteolibacter arcticus]MCW1924239.1 hypothetical protein [Luteolibacter arcticus]
MKSIVWLLLAGAALAAEPLKLPLNVGTLKTRDGKVFENATITGHDAVGVKIVHSAGVARVEFSRLPKELADRFPRDHGAAKEQLDREAKREAAHDRAVDKAPEKATPGKDAEDDTADTTPDTTVEKKPELKGDPEVKIASLEAYIRRLEMGIDKAKETVRDANEKADKYTNSATTTVTRRDKNGGTTTRSVTNESRLTRAESQRKRAAREQAKVGEAQKLIEEAKSQVAELKSQIK